jgi:hypothetical protein
MVVGTSLRRTHYIYIHNHMIASAELASRAPLHLPADNGPCAERAGTSVRTLTMVLDST